MSTESRPTSSNEVRKAFTDFFVERAHSDQASASLIPHDPTLLFTVAGMVPFKTYFTGEESPPFPRAVTIQKCVRAGGKHNDLDEIGRTKRHLTFFEMMGNFSFGDYFKEDAIPFAWELLTEVFGLDVDRLWVTCHLTDDEAEEIWATKVGVPRDRIQRLDEDNWWRMADTGPNGPCSEIFYDLGPEYGPDGGPENPDAEARFVEIWNLVFMQFDQQADGEQLPLPKPSIDTGAGLERVLTVLQGVGSVWETDEFVRLLAKASELSGVADGADPKSDVSLRILADHARSTTFMINDGVFPSNEDRGYVLRRIMRRAIRHAYLLGVQDPALPDLVSTVVEIMGDDYPEIRENEAKIRDIVEREEIRFRQTIETGLNILDTEMAQLDEGAALPGDVAFMFGNQQDHRRHQDTTHRDPAALDSRRTDRQRQEDGRIADRVDHHEQGGERVDRVIQHGRVEQAVHPSAISSRSTALIQRSSARSCASTISARFFRNVSIRPGGPL